MDVGHGHLTGREHHLGDMWQGDHRYIGHRALPPNDGRRATGDGRRATNRARLVRSWDQLEDVAQTTPARAGGTGMVEGAQQRAPQLFAHCAPRY
jgi:hypothetical protein